MRAFFHKLDPRHAARLKAFCQRLVPSYAARERFLERVVRGCATASVWIVKFTSLCCFGPPKKRKTCCIYVRKKSYHYSDEQFAIINWHLKNPMLPGEALDRLKRISDENE